MQIPVFFVDAFTDQPFRGNPAAVCYLHKNLDNSIKQKIAREIGFSETAFVSLLDENNHSFSLQWFTPELEIDLCGHATLSTAKVLFDYYYQNSRDICFSFHSKSGILKAYKDKDLIVLDFPVDTPLVSQNDYSQLAGILGIKSDYRVFECAGTSNLMFIIDSENEIKSLKPDYSRLKELNISPFSSVVVSAGSTSDFDFVSRCFAPWEGINEDPVTGSTHCSLAPYWAEILDKIEVPTLAASQR